jgi:carboxypeptidase Q
VKKKGDREMILRSSLAAVLALGATVSTAAPPADELLARTLAPTPVLDDLQHLTDVIGGRPTGSRPLDEAVEWATGRLRAAGLDDVHTEAWAAPRVWLPQTETAEVTAPLPGGRLRVAGMPFGANTPAGGLEAPVADVGSGDAAGFAAAGDVRGKWVLVHSEPMKSIEDLFKEYMSLPGVLTRLRDAGGAGLLYISTRPGRLLYRHNLTLDASRFPLPGVLVEREGGLRLARLLAAGKEARVKATVVADMPENASARNVVAELRGATAPGELVILGAHLDSWDLGRGALDNGCNVAMVIDVARQMAALAKAGIRPKRTIRFSLYTGEEAGLFGSLAEVRAHREELGRVKAQIIFDEGTGRTSGFSLGGREDLRAAVDAALGPASSLGPFVQTADAFVGTDNYDYLVEGTPNLVANQDGPPYLPDYHAESDTFDKVDARELKLNESIAAVVTWGLADSDRLPGRQSRAEVEALVHATGLDEQMKTFGYWDDFEAGRRGRAPEPAAPEETPAQP